MSPSVPPSPSRPPPPSLPGQNIKPKPLELKQAHITDNPFTHALAVLLFRVTLTKYRSLDNFDQLHRQSGTLRSLLCNVLLILPQDQLTSVGTHGGGGLFVLLPPRVLYNN